MPPTTRPTPPSASLSHRRPTAASSLHSPADLRTIIQTVFSTSMRCVSHRYDNPESPPCGPSPARRTFRSLVSNNKNATQMKTFITGLPSKFRHLIFRLVSAPLRFRHSRKRLLSREPSYPRQTTNPYRASLYSSKGPPSARRQTLTETIRSTFRHQPKRSLSRSSASTPKKFRPTSCCCSRS